MNKKRFTKCSPWANDQIQFARLLAELNAYGVCNNKKLMAFLRESMDLTNNEIEDLFDRAENKWEEIKRKMAL